MQFIVLIFSFIAIKFAVAASIPNCELKMVHEQTGEEIRETSMTEFTLSRFCKIDMDSSDLSLEENKDVCKKKLDSEFKLIFSDERQGEFQEPDIIKTLGDENDLAQIHAAVIDAMKDGKDELFDFLFSDVRVPITQSYNKKVTGSVGGTKQPLKFETLPKHFQLIQKGTKEAKSFERWAKISGEKLITREIGNKKYYEQGTTPTFSMGDEGTFKKALELTSSNDELLVGNYVFIYEDRTHVSSTKNDGSTLGGRILAIRERRTGNVRPLIQIIEKKSGSPLAVIDQKFIPIDNKEHIFIQQTGYKWAVLDSYSHDDTKELKISAKCSPALKQPPRSRAVKARP